MLTTAIETLTGSNKSDHSAKESLLPPGQLSRVRSKSLSILPSADTKLRRKLSKLHNLNGCQIFTINEHSPTGGDSKSPVTSSCDPISMDHVTSSQTTGQKRHKSAKSRRGSKVPTPSSKVPDITDFPLLLASPTELAAATRRKYSRAKSAPLVKLKTDAKSDALLDEESRALLGGEDTHTTTGTTSTASKTKGSTSFADNANYREQRQLERQLKGIQSLQRMHISSINKEKQHILKNSRALSSMLYPDVFTGKTPKCTRKGKCFGTGNVDPDSLESGTYLCDPSDGTSPYAEYNKQTRKRWNNAVSMVLKTTPKKGSKPNSTTKRK